MAWELKNLILDFDSIRMFVMKFFPEFLTEYPLDRQESKDYLQKKKEEFFLLCHNIETIDYPYFVYFEEQREKLCLNKAKIFFTKTGIDDGNISIYDQSGDRNHHFAAVDVKINIIIENADWRVTKKGLIGRLMEWKQKK